MPLPPITIRVARHTGPPLGTLMNEIRSWLDSKRIEPLEFRSAASEQEIGFDIRFRDEEQVDLFRRAFPNLVPHSSKGESSGNLAATGLR